MTMTHWLDSVKFNEDGLLPAIAQDKETGEILMVAWMNREALKLTAQTKTGVYFSRSRNKLWHKGETSGHKQIVHDLFLDCDNDVILLQITQKGGIACHTGRRSCFYKKLDLDQDTPEWRAVTAVIKNPDDIYGTDSVTLADKAVTEPVVANTVVANTIKSLETTGTSIQIESLSSIEDNNSSAILQQLDDILAERKQADPDSSYVASLYAKGINKILEKVGEEAVEAIIAAKDLAGADLNINGTLDTTIDGNVSNRAPDSSHKSLVDDLIYETADIWFHTMVTLAWFNIPSKRILEELSRRFGLSGIIEKNARSGH